MEVHGARFILSDGMPEPAPPLNPDPRDATPTMGYIAIAGKRPSEIARILRLRIEELDRRTDSRYGMDYCSTYPRYIGDREDDSPIRDRYRWTAVHPVTGGSEGHYLHVIVIYQRDVDGRPLDENQYREIVLIKLFGGWAAAAELSGIIGRWLDA